MTLFVSTVLSQMARGVFMADDIIYSSGILSIIEMARNNALKNVNEEQM